MTRGMWPTVYLENSNRSIRGPLLSTLFANNVNTFRYGATREERQRQLTARVLHERRSVVVYDRGALYFRRRRRDSDTGGGRDRYHCSHSGTIFDGDLYRLQAPKEERFEEEAKIENATAVSREKEERERGCEILGIEHVSDRCQRR
ncbi:hypothetical protein WH47_08979 [Habropoda laboriosa]|uniref:Uncharacterized protein n=1 Tax=Habropoda laboriosa TaxID=597456 RepID=A0A0L7R754_9HYME|nr:hypothetical protein WH47_08979 [Habropoda laboriosa]